MSEDEVILVVEDNEANQLLIRTVLEGAGYTVEVAASAAETLKRLALVTPALILMDVQLPGEDGLALTRRLKSRPETRSIPVVALTARAMPEDRDEALAAGCAGYIAKPIDVRTFPSSILRYLSDKQSAGM